MKNNILISIIIPCYNGEKYVKGCLNSILRSKYTNYEVIVVDDVSTDSSRNTLKSYRTNKQVNIYYLDKNKGPATARNYGVSKSRGQILLFLDIDTEIDHNCLSEIDKVFSQIKNLGAIQARLMLGGTNKLDTAGHFLSRFGFPYEVGVGENEAKHRETKEIFGARSAGMAVRKEIYNVVGGFDEDYLIYGEDTDLSWRIWLAGYSVLYIPTATVDHFSKSSLSDKTKNRIFYQGAKNNTGNILKNSSLTTIIWLLPLHLLGWGVICVKLLIQGRLLSAWSIVKGLFWNITHLTRVLNKRYLINKYIYKNNNVSRIIWGQLTLFTIISKGRSWYKNV